MSSLGVEYGCKYTLVGPDGTTVVFNDSTDPNFIGVLSPESSGLDSSDVREDATDAVEEDGGHHGDFFYGRRPVVLQGSITASSKAQRNERVGKLKRASNALRGDATLKWKPEGATEEGELKLRRQQPVRITKGYVKDFLVPMVSASAYVSGVTVNSIASTDTGLFSPGKGEGASWITPENVKASDNSYAVFLSGAGPASFITGTLIAKEFGLSIPIGAIIRGIEITIERKKSSGISSEVDTVKLVKGGVVSGAALSKVSGSWTEADTTSIFGGETSLGGLSLTSTDVNAAGFGASLSVVANQSGAVSLSVDQIKVRVYYTPTIVINGGDGVAFPKIKLYGPGTEFKVENATTEQFITINGVELKGAEYFEIDFKNHTIKKNGISNAYDALVFSSSTWWTLTPGENKIIPSSGKAEIMWQDAWL